MKFVKIICFVVLGLIALSTQETYNVEYDKTVYFVRQTGICVNRKTITCEDNEITENTYKNNGCTDTPTDTKTITCKKDCKCTDDLPSGQSFTFYDDENCENLNSNIISVAKENACFRFKKAEKQIYKIISTSETTFNLTQFPDNGCVGTGNVIIEGEYDECIKYPGANIFVKVENTGKFSESSSLILGVSSLITVLSVILLFI